MHRRGRHVGGVVVSVTPPAVAFNSLLKEHAPPIALRRCEPQLDLVNRRMNPAQEGAILIL
jgi:hypothetical protein